MIDRRACPLVIGGILALAGNLAAGELPIITWGEIERILPGPRYHINVDYDVTKLYAHGTRRGTMEFDASGLTGPTQGTLTIWQFDRSSTFNASMYLYAYEGDGNATIQDYDAPETFVAEVDFPAGNHYGVGLPFDTAVGSALRLAWHEGWRYLGLRLQVGESRSGRATEYASYYCRETATFGGHGPVLQYDPIPIGDANFDGSVDDDDLSVLLANYWNDEAEWGSGDFSGDGFVADNDLSLLLANWTGSTASVPEPGTLSLLAVGVVLLRHRRCR